MVIIGLYGAASTGKTTTLKMVASELQKLGATVQATERVYDKPDNRFYIESLSGLRICITTVGDDKDIQQENVAFVRERGDVDIWITASRTSGGSTGPIADYAKEKDSSILWIKKLSPVIIDSGNGYKYEKDKPETFSESICSRINDIDVERVINIIAQVENTNI